MGTRLICVSLRTLSSLECAVDPSYAVGFVVAVITGLGVGYDGDINRTGELDGPVFNCKHSRTGSDMMVELRTVLPITVDEQIKQIGALEDASTQRKTLVLNSFPQSLHELCVVTLCEVLWAFVKADASD